MNNKSSAFLNPKHNFFCPEIAENGKDTVALAEDESRHALRVLRLNEGDVVGLLDGRGTVAQAEVVRTGGGGRHPVVTAGIIECCKVEPPAVRLELFIATPRAKLMTQVVRQSTELGVSRITPVICEHNVAKPDSGEPKNRWLKEAVVAVKQSGNPFLPRIDGAVSFEDAVKRAPNSGVYGHAGGEGAGGLLDGEQAAVPEIGLWVGPEAGFSQHEVAILEENNYKPVSAGPWILRIETAVPTLIGWLRGRGVNV
ncbi:MAG: 16S rRNA (uracil(1498)-N(3))-methyltransferase [Lentisphaeria bacterium]